VLGRNFLGTSDSLGRYTISGLPFGAYVIAFEHLSLDTLGIESALQPITVTTTDQVVNLHTPPLAALMRAFCGREVPSDWLLLGRVFDTATRAPRVGASVFVYRSPANGAWSRSLSVAIAEVTTGESGVFALCGVNKETEPLAFQVSFGGSSTGRIPVPTANSPFRHVSLYVGGSQRATDEAAQATVVWLGAYAVSGIVLDSLRSPIAGAVVQVSESRSQDVTDGHGRFALTRVPGGSQTVEVRRVGFAPAVAIVHVGVQESDVSIQMTKASVILPKIAVTSARDLTGFEVRRRTGAVAGHFLGTTEIQRRSPDTPLSGLLTGIQGVRRVCMRGQCSLEMRRSSSTLTSSGLESCRPFLFVDGRRERIPEADGDFDFLRARQIEAIEVYTREVQVPAQFIPLAARHPCGVIVVWTKPER
jgi:hypothetical protein